MNLPPRRLNRTPACIRSRRARFGADSHTMAIFVPLNFGKTCRPWCTWTSRVSHGRLPADCIAFVSGDGPLHSPCWEDQVSMSVNRHSCFDETWKVG